MYSAKLKILIDKDNFKIIEKNTFNKDLIMEWIERSLDLNYYDVHTDNRHIINLKFESKVNNCKIICSTISEHDKLLDSINNKKNKLAKSKVGVISV